MMTTKNLGSNFVDRLLGLLLFCLFFCSCGRQSEPQTNPVKNQEAIFSISEDLPQKLSELRVYPKFPDTSLSHPQLIRYEPQHPLWTNNSSKQRFIYIPEGSQIDTQDPESFKFPIGTAVFKTFSYPHSEIGLKPVETRVFVGTKEGWKTAVYQWNKEATEARLRDISSSFQVDVEEHGHQHSIPDELQCRQCHETGGSFILGFDRRQLSLSINSKGSISQLENLYQKNIFSHPVSPEKSFESQSELDRQVLSYLYGNCVHCHSSNRNILDLSPGLAIDNLVDQRIQGVLLPTGFRVISGAASESRLYQAMTESSYQPMPPLGVDFQDKEFSQILKKWINSL